MKKQIIFPMMIIGLCFLLSSCISTVPAGYRGIKVYLLGNKRGVEQKQLGVGAYFLGFNQKIYTFPVFQQNYVWEANNSINFQSKEGLDVSGDFGISYSLIPDSVPAIFQKYRRGIDEITNIFLRNMVRDALNTTASHMPIESIYGVHKRDLLLKVDSMVSKQTKRYGIIIDRIYTIGELHLPGSIESAINAKLEANQRSQQSQNEVKTVEAEANKKIAKARGDAESRVIEAKAIAESQVIEAKAAADITKIKAAADAESTRLNANAQAEANAKLAKSLNPALIQYRSIDRWDGKLPQISGQNTPFINLNQPK
ncbi:MAG: prohibitin family protein [Bacteroidetes bacterium]|nr:prohibitin family protein [Bacteroidota bacterium]